MKMLIMCSGKLKNCCKDFFFLIHILLKNDGFNFFAFSGKQSDNYLNHV